MSNIQETEVRNYLTAGGLLLIGIMFLLLLLSYIPMLIGTYVDMEYEIYAIPVVGVVLLVLGILLLRVQKRDFAGISFIIIGASQLLLFLAGNNAVNVIGLAGGINFIWGIVALFSKDRQKWLFSLLNLLIGVSLLLGALLPNLILIFTLYGILILVSWYFSFAAGFERISLPGRLFITEDESTSFKQSGSSIGYVLFGAVALFWTISYLMPDSWFINRETLISLELGFGLLQVLFGILLLTIGKMRFTPVMFILMGVSEMLVPFSTGMMGYALGALIIITGLFAILRTESRILPALMLITYGITFFISTTFSGVSAPQALSVILNLVPAFIALYLAVATLSQRKIPLI